MPTTNILHISATPAKTAASFASFLLQLDSERQAPNAVALSGGSTPNLLFKHLRTAYQDQLRWDSLQLFWGDERCVPHNHEESNFGTARTLLLDHAPIQPAQLHPINCQGDPAAEATRYAQLMRDKLPAEAGVPVFQLVILGLGADGHTASIFPGSDLMQEQAQLTGVATHPESGQKRISITLPVINQAEQVVFLVTGASKAERVADILHKRPGYQQYPAAAVQPISGHCHWFLDEAAASQLKTEAA